MAVVGAATVVASPAGAVDAAIAATPRIERVSAPDAASLAAAVSARTFPTRTPTVYIASAATFPDALAAGGAAGGDAPILLVDPAGVAAATTAELQRLAPTRLVVLGGTAAVPEAIATQLTGTVPSATLTRIAGADRYETAAMTSAWRFSQGATRAYLATGADFPDALAAGAASAGKSPILLTTPDAAPDSTLAELERLNLSTLVVLGGTAAVTDAVLDTIRAALPTLAVTRVAGADRYATAAKLARTIAPTATGQIVVAPGSAFAPALVAAPAAARAHAPLLLVDAQPSTATTAELARRGLRALLAVGDIGDETTTAITTAASPEVPAPLLGATKAVATAQAQIGKAYQWGAAGPDAFDCSGLTLVAWQSGGVTLPHNSEAQAYAVAGVSFTALQPGDLLFYGSPIGHVALYQGDGMMIEAPRSGVPVRTASIWRTDLIAAGRPTSD